MKRFRIKVNDLSYSFPSVFHIINIITEKIIIIHSFADSKEIPYETSRSVYSLLQICYRCAGRSADKLQIICRMSVEYLQNICRMSAERLQRRPATSLQICRRSADENQPIMLNKEPTKCTNQTTFI